MRIYLNIVLIVIILVIPLVLVLLPVPSLYLSLRKSLYGDQNSLNLLLFSLLQMILSPQILKFHLSPTNLHLNCLIVAISQWIMLFHPPIAATTQIASPNVSVANPDVDLLVMDVPFPSEIRPTEILSKDDSVIVLYKPPSSTQKFVRSSSFSNYVPLPVGINRAAHEA